MASRSALMSLSPSVSLLAMTIEGTRSDWQSFSTCRCALRISSDRIGMLMSRALRFIPKIQREHAHDDRLDTAAWSYIRIYSM